MKYSDFVQAAIIGASIAAVQAHRLAKGERELHPHEFGDAVGSMSISANEIVQLASFDDSAASGPGDTVASASIMSAKGSKELGTGAASASIMSAKGSKELGTGASGKSGKGDSKLNNRIININLPVPTAGADQRVSRVLFKEGPYEVIAECDLEGLETQAHILVRTINNGEQVKYYGQNRRAGPQSGVLNATPVGDEGAIWTLFSSNESGTGGTDNEGKNDPESGAFAFIGLTSGQRNYVGIDGSSFIANINAASGSTPPSCDFSGVINTGYSASDSSVMISSKGSKNPANHQQSKASKSVVTSTTSTFATTTTTSTTTCKEYNAECQGVGDTSCCPGLYCKTCAMAFDYCDVE